MYVVHTSSEIAYATVEPTTPPPGFQVSEVVAPAFMADRVREVYRIVQGRVVPKCVVGLYPERTHLVADGVNQVTIRVELNLRQPEDTFRSITLLVDGQPVEVSLDDNDQGFYVFSTTQPGGHRIEVPLSDTFAASAVILQAWRP